MRKIIESVLMSADGAVGNPADWGVVDYRDDEVQQEALNRLSGCDAAMPVRCFTPIGAVNDPVL